MLEIKTSEFVSVNSEGAASWLEHMTQPRFREFFCLMYAVPEEDTLSERSPVLLVSSPDSRPTYPPESFFSCKVALCWFSLDAYERLYPLLPLLARRETIPAEGALRTLAESFLEVLLEETDVMLEHVASRLLEALLYALVVHLRRTELPGQSPLVRRALAYMQTNLMRNIGLAELCRTLGVSQEHFIRTFKREMHISPMKHYNTMRLHKAVDMLLQGMSVHDVSTEMDFYNESHFSKMFKQYLGVTPRTYKLTCFESLRQRRIRSDQQLALAVSLLSEFVDAIPDFFFVKDLQFVNIICNQAYSNFVGRKKELVCGKTDFELFPHDAATFFRMTDTYTFASGKSSTFRRRITYPDGRMALMETTKSPCFDASGRLLGLVCVGRNLDGTSRVIEDTEITT